MKLFIYEHITSGALIDEPLPSSLAREGNDMLMAIVDDLIQLPHIDLIILRDIRLEPLPNLGQHQVYTIDSSSAFQKAYQYALHHASTVLPIAPETSGILSEIQKGIADSRTQLLACDAEATLISSDKYRCYQKLLSHGILSPETVKAAEWSKSPFSSSNGFIVKPQDGAGCIDTFFSPDKPSLEAWLSSGSDTIDNRIIQPFVEGLNISLTLLADNDDIRVLAINQQKILRHANSTVSFLGSIVNGVDKNDFSLTQATQLAEKVHQAIAGLWGFVGIDLILHEKQCFVIDINPRLTTSYIGLKQSLDLNPAQLLFTMMEKGCSALPKTFPRHTVEVLV